METIKEYAQRVGLTTEVVRDRGAQIEDGWEHHAYVLRLSIDDRSMETPWKQGYGVEAHPTDVPWDVLGSLVLDAHGALNVRFGDEDEGEWFARWAGEYGYDEDSRKAYATFQRVREMTDRLRVLLGDDFEYVLTEVDVG
jgi:hypothetical protein